MTTVTKSQAVLVARMRELVQDRSWEALPSRIGPTVRFTQTMTTPDYARGSGWGQWDELTYARHLFLTLVAGKVILRVCAAPWLNARDSQVPLWLASAILGDPVLGFDTDRQLRMRAERKDRRS